MVGKGQAYEESAAEELGQTQGTYSLTACHVSTPDSISRVSVPESAAHESEGGVLTDGSTAKDTDFSSEQKQQPILVGAMHDSQDDLADSRDR